MASFSRSEGARGSNKRGEETADGLFAGHQAAREINCSLCLRDTRKFCNWMIEVGPGMIDCAALLFVAG